ncbi:MAG: uncharacterized protein JWM88_1218, partial [Verrucomicrobia bacterium]|nr:uncharacterized protein [Verrucomicrobiota bacterium]
IDGSVGSNAADSNTVKAIEAFQARFTGSADGVVDVHGQTFPALLDAAGEAESAPTPAGPVAAGACLFPFTSVPAQNWTSSPRSFASNRNGGSRLHAGCDLYFPRGTPIHAVADGVVVRGPYSFYAQTFALEVDHGAFIARYGEIQEATLKRAGDRVSAGERIASVGHLVGITVPSDMLHFELYDKSASGPLTVAESSKSAQRGGVPFMRRKDLFDPTSSLNQWQNSLPAA